MQETSASTPNTSESVAHFDSGSFRDRNSRVIIHQGQVYRALDSQAASEWHTLKSTRFYARMLDNQQIIGTEESTLEQFHFIDNSQQNWQLLLKHETIDFISYPYEWAFSMLKDAALLHLNILIDAINEDMILKDATPYNIQWRGDKPVFIDIGSFVQLEKGQAWPGYRQFCELFLFPLMLQAHKGVNFHNWLKGSIDGINAEDFANIMSLRDLLRPGVLLHVILQAKLQRRHNDSKTDVQRAMKQAGFSKQLILNNLNGIKKLISKLEPTQQTSTWSHYTEQHNYSSADMQTKESLVDKFIKQGYATAWDFGCNTGKFSRIAARHCRQVLSLDFDSLAIEYLYTNLKQEPINNITPLVFNLADPSPNLGWRNLERKPLGARGSPDIILSLALIHHLVIGANIPLNEVIEYFYTLGGDLVIEFVDREDSMVKKLLLNKQDIYHEYNRETFERLLKQNYSIAEQHTLESGNRTLYYAKRNN